jgi:hypothetical protein
LSQPFSASQYQNPSSAGGGAYDHRFLSNYKNQLVDGNADLFRTFLFSFDTRLKNDLEVALLISAYDIRTTHDALFPFGESQDLFSMIKSKIGNDILNTSAILHGSDWRLKEINSNWNSKGITYKI